MKAKLQWRLTPALSALSAAAGTKRLLALAALAAGTQLSLPACARSAAADCAKARDPVRCEARQAALETCADKRGKEKQVCLEAGIPPADCSRAQNPQSCEAIQKAGEICKGKTGKELKTCLRDQQPRTKKKSSKHRTTQAS